MFKPKTFAGLFGSAPSVALTSLAFAFANKGDGYAFIEARSMAIGGVALFAYACACLWVARKGSRRGSRRVVRDVVAALALAVCGDGAVVDGSRAAHRPHNHGLRGTMS